MRLRRWALALAGALLLVQTPADAGVVAFDRFAALAGDWVAAESGEMVKKGDLVARYRLTGAGTAVVEELFPGTPHEMLTVYHRDGEDLVLTHYCMTGNQPRMRARPTDAARIAFAFDGGTNLDPARDQHMHSASFEFVSADEIRSQWVEHEGGAPKLTVTMHLVRRTSRGDAR